MTLDSYGEVINNNDGNDSTYRQMSMAFVERSTDVIADVVKDA